VRRLDQVLEDVLSVRGPELEAPEDADHLGVDVGDPDLADGPLPRALDLLLDLAAGPLEHLLDPGRMDAPVLDELVEGQPGHLATHGVEGGEHDGLGRVVDDEVHPGGGLEGPDVPALAADDPPLQVVRGQGEDADRRLRGLFRGHPLDRHGDHLAGPGLGLLPSLLLDLPDRCHGVALGLVGELGDEAVLGLLSRHTGDLLELATLLLLGSGELVANPRQLLLALLEGLLLALGLRDLGLQLLLALGQARVTAAGLLAPGADVLLRLLAHAGDLVLDLGEALLNGLLRLGLRFGDELLGAALGGVCVAGRHRLADGEPDGHAGHQRHQRGQCDVHRSSLQPGRRADPPRDEEGRDARFGPRLRPGVQPPACREVGDHVSVDLASRFSRRLGFVGLLS
jgi:hypothetical protein